MFAPCRRVDAGLIAYRRPEFPVRERIGCHHRQPSISNDIGRQHMLSVDCCFSVAKTDFPAQIPCAVQFRSGILFRMRLNFKSNSLGTTTVIVAVPARARPPG